MHLIVCVEDRMGMLFHARRLSRDREATRRIVQLAGQGPLWVSPYSQGLFQDCPPPGGLRVSPDFLACAGPEELCFVEDADILPFSERISRVFLLRWNRTYPFDTKFPLDLNAAGWICRAREEFPGFSHPKITLEAYYREHS